MATAPINIAALAARAPEKSAERIRKALIEHSREIDHQRRQHGPSLVTGNALLQSILHGGGPNYRPDPHQHGLHGENLIDQTPHGLTIDDLLFHHPSGAPMPQRGSGVPGSGGRPAGHGHPFFLVPYGNRTEAVAVPTTRGEYEQLTPHELHHYILHYHGQPR